MKQATVVLVGNPVFETAALDLLVPEFGWRFEIAADLGQLRDLVASHGPIAILFDSNSLGLSCRQALSSVRSIAPQALMIPCHRFSDLVNWPELAEAGAFHALSVPLDPAEVRQSLSFVWSARFRQSANVLPIRRAEHRVAASPCRCGDGVCRCTDTLRPVKRFLA